LASFRDESDIDTHGPTSIARLKTTAEHPNKAPLGARSAEGSGHSEPAAHPAAWHLAISQLRCPHAATPKGARERERARNPPSAPYMPDHAIRFIALVRILRQATAALERRVMNARARDAALNGNAISASRGVPPTRARTRTSIRPLEPDHELELIVRRLNVERLKSRVPPGWARSK
jgi:hypothetical protein